MNKINKWVLIFSCIFFSYLLHAQKQIKTTKIDTVAFPAAIKYSGIITDGIIWTEKNEKHLVFTTETGIVPTPQSEDEGNNDAYLYAYHFIIHGDSAEQIWKLTDFVKECPLDIEATFIKNTLQVTDLNNNGVPEIWLMYKTVCHGDVSPATLKIIMYQDKQKFAMRGRTKIKISNTGYEGGECSFDSAFISAPAAFRDFAKTLWNKNVIYKWE